jgi:hypothetical protein
MALWVLVLVGSLSWAPLVRAHPLSPAAIVVNETGPNRYDLSFRRSALAARTLVLDLPATCEEREPQNTQEADQLTAHVKLVCTRPLEGQTLRVLGLAELSLGALVYVKFADGRTARALLSPEQPSFTLPRRSAAWHVLRDYVRLGIEHLLTGVDHLLFVAGLMLLVQGARRLLLMLTAFTLGHSVTLCLAALSLVSVPQAPVEVGIALSLVALALGLLAADAPSAFPWWMAGGFGLLHGLGFAGALAETGLPADAIPLSLFGFNLGVEIGQLLVVATLAVLMFGAGRLTALSRVRFRSWTAYAIGSLAAMWCIERSLDWLR